MKNTPAQLFKAVLDNGFTTQECQVVEIETIEDVERLFDTTLTFQPVEAGTYLAIWTDEHINGIMADNVTYSKDKNEIVRLYKL